MVTYPNDWNERSLNDVVKIKRGASPRPIENYLTKSSSGASWIKIGDAPRNGKYIVRTDEKIKMSGAAHSVWVYKDDFILSNSMSFGRPYLLGINGCIHDGWLRLYDFQNDIDSEYLYYLLSSPTVKEQYSAFAAGSGVQNLNKEVVKKVKVCLPDIPEQKRIATNISIFDEHIDNLTELIEKKKAIRDGALEDLVSGRTRVDGFDGEWEEKPLSKICDVFDGTHQTPHYTVNGIKFVSVENIANIYKSDKYISKFDFERDFRIYPQKGDILMTRIGDIGSSCIVETDEPIAYYVSLALFKSITINSLYLNQYIKGKNFQRELDDRTLHHATPQKINKGEIGKCKVRYPVCIDEQKAIAETLSSMDEEIQDLETEKEKMIQIREGAMDDLLTGRVRLKI